MRTRQQEIADDVRIVAGQVATNGTVPSGTGDFTVTKTGTGQYTVTFAPRMKVILSATANAFSNLYGVGVSFTANQVIFSTFATANNVATDIGFLFTVVGR